MNPTRSEVESERTPEGPQIDRFTIYSPSMGRDIRVAVVLPAGYAEDGNDERYPVLYTLHGRGAPYDTWAKMSKLRKQLAETPFIYTCFDADNASYYLDAAVAIPTARGKPERGGDPPKSSKFLTFFFKEFLPAVDVWYRVEPKARGVTGFSMGGSGAMTYMLEHPDLFCSVSGLSSAFLNTRNPASITTKSLPQLLGPPGDAPERYEAVDHYLQIEKHLASGRKLPPILQHIGSDDFLLDMNRRFRDFAEAEELDLTYRESPGGHDWKFWHAASVGVAEFHWRHFRKALKGRE